MANHESTPVQLNESQISGKLPKREHWVKDIRYTSSLGHKGKKVEWVRCYQCAAGYGHIKH